MKSCNRGQSEGEERKRKQEQHSQLPSILAHYSQSQLLLKIRDTLQHRLGMFTPHTPFQIKNLISHRPSKLFSLTCSIILPNRKMQQCAFMLQHFFSCCNAVALEHILRYVENSIQVPVVCCCPGLLLQQLLHLGCSFLLGYKYFCSEVFCLTWYACLIHKNTCSLKLSSGALLIECAEAALWCSI